MPNLMNDIFSTSSTFTTLQNLKKDADKIRSTLMEDIKSTSVSVSNFKRTNRIAQKITRWFSDSSGEDDNQSPLEDQSDDFDAGFQYGNEDNQNKENNDEESPLNISEEETKELFDAHTKQMILAASKKFDVKLHNMFEVKKSMDTRVSEILASTRTTESILKKILSQLDQIINFRVSVDDRLQRAKRNTLLDSSGRLSLDSVKNFIKQNQTRVTKSFVQTLMDVTGLSTLDQTVNETIQTFTSQFAIKIMELPGLKKLFNFRKTEGNIDYSVFINPRYDRKKAIFDGATRKSIVNIIPDYLRKITQFVTGKKYNINQHGNLTTRPQSDQFKSVINVTFDISPINERRINSYAQQAKEKNPEVSSADAKEVLRLLVEQYVAQMYHGTTNVLSSDKLKSGGDLAIHRHVLHLLIKSKGGKIAYWNAILESFSMKLQLDKYYREEFAISVNNALKRLDERARQHVAEAQTVTDTKFTQKMFDEMASTRLSYDSTKFEHEGKTLRQLIKEKVITKDQLTEKQLQDLDKKIESFEELYEKLDNESYLATDEKLTDVQELKKKYADDIFTTLNNGINTFFVQRRKPFGPIKLAKQKKDYSNEPTQTIILPSLLQQNTSGSQNQNTQKPQPIQQAKVFKNIGNKISSITNKIKDRLKNPFNKMKSNLKSDYDTFVNDPSKQKNLLNAASKEDRQKVQEINAMVKAAVNSGSSDTDIAAIRTRISSISNEQLKIQTKKTVDGIIERGGKDPEAKSMLGKALLLVLGLGKKFINGIISKIKTLSDKRNSFIMKSVDSGIAGMKQGAKTLKEGFIGSDQSKGIVKRVTDFAKPKLLTLKENVVNSKPAQALINVGKKITDKFKQSNFGQGFMKATHIGETPAVTTHDKTSQSIADKLTYGAGTVFDTIVNAVNTMGDKISEWMNLSIDKKRNEASKKKKSKNPQTQKKQSTSFALGMIMGGFSSILSNVISMVAKIVMSLKGFQALSKMLNDAIMKVAKPLNKAFQSLSKAIQKPLDIITDTLTKIVDSVSGILVSIVESIAPTLQSILPLVEMIVPIFKTIYDIQVEVVKVILAPVLSIFETTIGGDLKKSSNTQDSIKNTLTSTFGLVGQTLGGILSVVSAISQFLGGTIGDKMQTEVVMQQSSMMTEYGANQLNGTAQQKVALYNGTPSSTSTTSQEVGESARTNSSNKFTTNFGSPMDGIVGSGDFNAPYKFDENVQDAIMNLQEIASGITSLFTGGDTDVFKSVDKSTTAQKYQQAQYETASFTESEREAIDKRAFELFKNGTTTERLIGESDADYRARYEKVKEKYWAQAAMEAVHDKVKRVADGTDEGASSIIGSVLGTTGDKFLSAMDEMYSSSESGGLERMMKDYPMYSEEDMYYDDGGEYYDTGGGSYYEGGTGDIFKAASEVFVAARKAVGGDLKWNGTSAFNLKFDDGMVIDKISPTHCTSMMTAIVKRMGYYVPGNKAYTDTYQGTDQLLGTSGGHGSKTWGLQSSDGHPNIYNRDGSVSQDWIIVPKGQTKAGDITFGGIGGNIHAHMGAYQGAGGYWFGFNGGRDDSLKNSVRLAEYYLSHGTMPPSSTVGIQTEGKRYDQQLGAIAHPMSLGVRYVGPKTRGTVKKSASMTSSRRGGDGYNGGSVSGDFKMRTTRPEAGNKYYIMDDTGGYSPAIKGKPTDPINNVLCNCVGYAMGRFFEIQGDPNFTHTFNANGGTPIYRDAIAKGFKTSPTPALGSMIVWNHPGGGGHVGIVENIGPDGSIDISQSGYGSYDFKYNTYTKESNYSNSSNKLVGFVLQPRTYSQPYSAQVESSTRAAARRRGSSTTIPSSGSRRSSGGVTPSSTANMAVSTGNVVGGNKALTAAAETMIAIKKAYGSAPTQGTWVSNVKFDDGMVIDGVSAMCTGTQAAIIKRMGYYLAPDKGKTYSSTYQGNHGMQWANGSPAGWGVNNSDGHPNIFDRNGNKSQDWIISRDGSYQPGDISLPSKAWGRYDTTAWHAHMGAFKYKGKWYGFNGGNPSGSNAQTNKSINLANFYLQHGRMPTESDNININDYNASGGNQGIVIRYVGPQTGTRVASGGTSTRSRGGSTVAMTGRSRGGTSGSTMVASRSGGNNSDWIRQVAMMFEGYYYNGDKVYDNGKKGLGTIHKVPMRDGRTVKVRPDCSGMLGGAISAFGYDLQYPPSSTHYNIVGYTGSWKSGWNPTYIKDANGNVSKDWEFWKIKDTTIQPGDILGREGHATFAVSGSGTNWRGMDAGGTSNIKESAKYAREYLDTGNTQWRGIKVSDMTNILRYVGGGGTTYYTTTGTPSSGGGRSRGGVVSTRTSSRSRGRSRNISTNMNTGARVTNPSAPLSGSSNQEKIFNYLTINKGMSPIGAAGMMGCFEHESNFKPNILENTYKQRFGYSKGDAGDIQYTNAVNTGKESEYNFVHSRGTNTAGYGIPQFTAPNVKQDLYDRTVKRGKSIDSIDSQMDSIMSSLTKSKYKGTTLANAISSASTPTEANQYFLWRYEAGVAYNSDAAVNKAYGGDISTKRHKSAEKWYRQFAGGDDYVDSLLIDDNFNMGPVEQFMTDPTRQGDLIYTDLDENIPYQKINGPMMIPALDVNGGIPQDNEDGFVIVNQINYTAQTYDVLFKHIDQVLTTEYNVQSTTIRNLVEQINEEFPEYIDWYFSEDDGYSEEDDMEILQMASNFV